MTAIWYGSKDAESGCGGLWRDDVPSDLEILIALRERAPAPMSVAELAERCGLAPERVSMRMRSLISLRWVECRRGAKDEAYALATAVSWPSEAAAPAAGLAGVPLSLAARRTQLVS
jgi:DNA-binding IclR family transcriptional regulator